MCNAFKSENMKNMIRDASDDVIKILFDSVKIRYKNNLELMGGSEFFLYYVQLLQHVIKQTYIVENYV